MIQAGFIGGEPQDPAGHLYVIGADGKAAISEKSPLFKEKACTASRSRYVLRSELHSNHFSRRLCLSKINCGRQGTAKSFADRSEVFLVRAQKQN